MLEIGIIGCGYWGPNLVRNFWMEPSCGVRAIADLSDDRLRTMSRTYPGIRTTRNSREITHSDDIDAVVIATPVSTHYELAKAALEQGKHVLVTKPLAQNSEQAAHLVELAERHGRTLLVDHTFLFTGAVMKIRELIRSGEIGDVYAFDSVRVNLGLLQSDVNVLWDLATHDISILDYVLDEPPVAVSAVGADPLRYSRHGLESVAYVTFRLESGALAHVHASWLSPVKIRRTLISGSRRMLVYDHLDPDHQIKLYDKGVDISSDEDRYQALVQYRIGDMAAPKIDPTEALAREAAHFVSCCENGTVPLSDGADGLRVVLMLEAAQRSIREGREIPLDLPPRSRDLP